MGRQEHSQHKVAIHEAPATELGKARLRKEDARLLIGESNWTDNIVLPGMLYMAFVRSPYAHARIRSVDLSAARSMSGVVAAFSGADFPEQGNLPCAWPATQDIVIPPHPPMATDEVRYVGEAVAVVIARDRYAAADALSGVDVEYEPLPPVLDMRTALNEESPRVHPQGNKSYEWTFANGELDAAFRDAPVVIERTFRQQRLIPSAMEPRAVVADCVGGEFTIWSATQIPHILRVMLAMMTGTPEQLIRVIAPDVGGGFGSKLQVTAEEVIAMLAARKLGRPVKWTESRSEGNHTVHHGRDQIQRIRLAADADGRIRGLDVALLTNMGAYLMLVTPGVPLLGAFMYNAIYKMDAYRFNCTGVFTTTMPTDAYRGAGRPEATFAIERMMDELAAHLGIDPLELRERNWIKHEEFPYTTIAGMTYDSGNYEAATAAAKDLFHYDELRKEQSERNSARSPVRLGIGVSTYTEMCGLAPSRILGSLRYGVGGWEHASIRILPTGKVEVVTGSSAHGQGHETAWSQIVADELGVPFEDIRVLHGDTQVSPKGMDTYGSRSLTVGGTAVVMACGKVREKARAVAAAMLEVSPSDLEWANGRWSVRGDPEKGKTIGEIAFATFGAHNLPEGVEPSLDSDATYDSGNFSFPHGTHLCAVEVDTETGKVRIRSYVAVDDVGVVVNPLIVEGQVHGGLAQGIGQALYEEAVYDSSGNLETSTLADYLIPSAADLPSFTTARSTTPSSGNPLGAKGVGEAGTIASTPAVVNAIVDALRAFGVRDVPMPCTPERVWRAIHDALDDLATKEGELPERDILIDESASDVLLPPPSPPPSPPPPPPSSPEAAEAVPLPSRYLIAKCPDTVSVGQVFHLMVSVALSGGLALKQFAVPREGLPLLLVIHAPGLRALSGHRETVHIPPDHDSEPVRFDLIADKPGPRRISVTAWDGGSYLGELPVDVNVEHDASARPDRTVHGEISTERVDGEVTLVVRYDPVQNSYRFEFRDVDNPDEVTSNLAYEPGPLVEHLVADLDDLVRGRSGYSADQARSYLVNAGARLWSQLVPQPLREQFWERQYRIRQLTILADKDAVPWELLYPMDPGYDAGFLVEQFPVTRAIFRWLPSRTLNLWPSRFVLPEGSLPEARDEIDAMRRLLDPEQPPAEVISALTQLTNLIASGDFGLLHFACHNTYNPADGSSIKLGKVQFTPTLMTTASINKVLEHSAPIVFMNACRSAGSAATYNRLDGWANKFLEAGAGAFIGSLWAVSDGAAREFAQEFYGQLQAGSPLGTAVMRARQAVASQSDDPTWLAYTVYGNPRATIS